MENTQKKEILRMLK